MSSNLIEFRWMVPSTGFQWAERQIAGPGHKVARVLTHDVPVGVAATVRSYNPLRETTGLFRDFAGLGLTEHAIAVFANRYGSLGGDDEVAVVTPQSGLVGTGERFEVWCEQITLMRQSLQLWDAARAGDTRQLARHIRWVKPAEGQGAGVRYDSHPHLKPAEKPHTPDVRRPLWIAFEPLDKDLLESFRAGDVIAPAYVYLQQVVNKQLQKYGVTARLLRDRNNHSSLTLKFVPSNLIGALWLQLAKAIEGNAEFSQCGQCKKWYEIGSNQTARADKKFCTPTCKANAHRKKIARARDLHATGLPAKEIAQRLETDVKTVRGWISK